MIYIWQNIQYIGYVLTILKLSSYLLFLTLICKIALASLNQPPTAVETINPEKKLIFDKIHSISIINSPKSVYLLAQSAGEITHIYHSNGGAVKTGDLLAQLDDQVASSNFDVATANVNLSQLKLGRVEKLLAAKVASQADYDTALAELIKFKAEKRKAQDEVKKTKIVAPFDGIIGFKLKQEFETVNIGDKLFRIEQFNPLEVEFRIPHKFYNLVQLGDKVNLNIDNNGTTEGQIIAISTIINLDDESFSIKASVENSDNKIVPGMFTSIEIIANRHEALIIPIQALVFTENDPILFKLENDKIRQISVKKGIDFGNMTEIKSGISTNDQIIISGQMKLYEGMSAYSLTEKENK